MRAAMRSSCRVRSIAPAPRGSPRAARLRAGAGLVTVASPRDALAVNAAQLTAIMVREADDARGLKTLLADQAQERRADRARRRGRASAPRTMVLRRSTRTPPSCSTPTRSPRSPTIKRPLFAAIASRAAAVVLTPHDGEFARLFGDLVALPKLERARQAAARSGAIIALEGRRHRRGRAGREGLDQRHHQPVARHRRHRRCAWRHGPRPARPGDAGVRGDQRRRLAAWRRGQGLRTGPDRRGSTRDAAFGPARAGGVRVGRKRPEAGSRG